MRSAILAIFLLSFFCTWSDTERSQLIERILDLENRVEALEDVVVRLVNKLDAHDEVIKGLKLKDGDIKIFPNSKAGKKIDNQGSIAQIRSKNPATEKRDYDEVAESFTERNYAEMTKKAESFLQAYPESLYAGMLHFWLGEARMVYGDHLQAKEHYEKAVSLDRNHIKAPDIQLKLAVIAYEGGETGYADKLIANLIKSYPKSSAAHLAALQKKKYHASSR